jgi:cytochrome c5
MTRPTQTFATRISLLGAALVAVVIAACGSAATPTPTPPPPTATPEPTARPEIVALGKATFIRIGCVACHAIKDISDQAISAPRLDQAYQLAVDTLKSPEYKKSNSSENR